MRGINKKNGSEDDDAGATEEAPFFCVKDVDDPLSLAVASIVFIRFRWFRVGGARVGPFFGNLHGFAK